MHESTWTFTYSIASEDGTVQFKGEGQRNIDLTDISEHLDNATEAECEAADCRACLGMCDALDKATDSLKKRIEEISGVFLFGGVSRNAHRVKFQVRSLDLCWRPKGPATRSTEFVGGDTIVFQRIYTSIDDSRDIFATMSTRLISAA